MTICDVGRGCLEQTLPTKFPHQIWFYLAKQYQPRFTESAKFSNYFAYSANQESIKENLFTYIK